MKAAKSAAVPFSFTELHIVFVLILVYCGRFIGIIHMYSSKVK